MQNNNYRVFEKLSDAAEWTPMVKLHKSVKAFPNASVYAKLEFTNPMGSVKDRIGRHLVRKAIAQGKLKPGDTIIENSSGNTAMGLAMMAVEYDLNCRIVVRSTTAKAKLDALRAVGADLILVDPTLPPEHPDSYNKKVYTILAQHPEYYFPDQHNNLDNNEAHYLTTGPEIWQQMSGEIDFVVAGIGTGGTLTGAAKYLKEQDSNIKIIAVDPVGSVFYDYFKTGKLTKPSGYLIEGLGDEELIKCVNFEYIDDIIQVTNEQAIKHARRLAKQEAILAGGSSGAALFGVRSLLNTLDADKHHRIVTIFSDSGNRYLSTIYNDDWLIEKGIDPKEV